jgi:tetratricopeptide (TPR) repeat protein
VGRPIRWALEDVFDLQDQITDRVVGIVEPSRQRSEIERARRKHPDNLDAYDLYLRALPHLASITPANARTAAGFLERALELDPNCAAAHARLAHYHEILFSHLGFDDAERRAGIRHARLVMTSATDDATALAIAAFQASLLSNDHEAALGAIERALSLNPSCAAALYFGALIYAFSGKLDAATVHASRALRLSPFDPLAFQAHAALGFVALLEARYDEAASHHARAVQGNPHFGVLYFNQAVSLALAGRLNEARPIVRRGLELQPGFQTRIYAESGVAPELIAKVTAGARLLGLPE